MLKRIRFIVFTVLIVVITATTIYADRLDSGWKGYGLYNLNKSEISIQSESDAITITGGNTAAVYEYSIKNESSKDITVNFGYPDNGIYKFSVYDGSKYIKYKTRETSYLKDNYGVSGLQTPDGRWYLFNMVFTPGQTRTIKVSIEAEMKRGENDAYPLNFFKDRSYSYATTSKQVTLKLKFSGFKPYNIFELQGISPEAITNEGDVSLSFNNGYGSGASLTYQPIDRMALEKLNASTYKKPKAIVKAFYSKNYTEALALSNEYISAPSDKSLNLEQVKFIKAECSRLLSNNEDYLKTIGQLDITKLYPGRIKYKVMYDSLEVYNSMSNDKAIDNLLAELLPETQQGYPYFYYWLNQNGYKISESKNDSKDTPTSPVSTNVNTSPKKSFNIIGAVSKVFVNIGKSRWTYAIFGLVIGFIAGRMTKRGKKRKSVYLFRD